MKRIISIALISLTMLAIVATGNGTYNPPEGKEGNILDVLDSKGFESFLKLIVNCEECSNLLSNYQHFTVFAPTDYAFENISRDKFNEITSNKTMLGAVIAYHIVPELLYSNDLSERGSVETLQGENIKIGNNGNLTVNDARIIKNDIKATNGIIQGIDTVLNPTNMTMHPNCIIIGNISYNIEPIGGWHTMK